jgi:ankyrin repeat protein
MERITGNTVLHTVCDVLTDYEMVEIVISNGADVNAVRNDDKLPLNIINAKLQQDPENETLLEIKDLLERKGAKTDWRNYN